MQDKFVNIKKENDLSSNMNFSDFGERQSRLILERIHQCDKNYAHLVESIGALARKETR